MTRRFVSPKHWNQLSIYRKTAVLLGCMVVVLCILVLFIIFAFQQYRAQTTEILNEHASISGFLAAFSSEDDLLQYRVRRNSVPANSQYVQAYMHTNETLNALMTLPSMSQNDKMLRHAISNAMEHYRADQRTLLQTLAAGGDYVPLYYSMHKQFVYVDQYSKSWLRSSVQEGSQRFHRLINRMRAFYSILFALLILAFLAFVFGCGILMRSIIVPLAALSESAASFQAGNRKAPLIKVQSNDEIGRLAMSLNSMQCRVNEAFEELSTKAQMEQQLRQHEQRESQMRRLLEERRFAQLQSQINPHFLFNTLNTIASMANMEHATVTKDLIVRLSKLFRYSLDTDEKLVPLWQELQIVSDYMELQETRFGDRFDFEVINAAPFRDLKIPKFIIQPLAENSVIHGMRDTSSGGKIRLSFREHGPDSVRIFLTDNGCGFHSRGTTEQRSVGLSNICNRMEMFGGKIHIFSILGVGTTVCLTVSRKELS